MSATETRIDERNISGRPTKFAVAIIDASLRTRSAIPLEKPAKTIASSAAAARTTIQPGKPPVHAHTQSEPDQQEDQCLYDRGDAGAENLREHNREARCGCGEETVDDVTVEVGDHRHARPRAAEERVHADDAGKQERDIRRAARPLRARLRE